MARIVTTLGDLTAPVSVTKDDLMDTAELSFTLPLSDELVAGGVFNPWKPITVSIRDGGDNLVYPCWVTMATRSGATLVVQAKSSAVWLERGTIVRVTSDTKRAGEHLADLVDAYVADTGAPLALGTVEIQDDVWLSLPDQRLTLRSWLDWLVAQTSWEWSIGSDPDQPNIAILNWQKQIGTEFSGTAVINGETVQIAALAVGRTIYDVKVDSDGLAIFSRVRVTAPGLPDYIATDDALMSQIGLHETTVDLGPGATATDQEKAAAVELSYVTKPATRIRGTVPRSTGLWSQLALGDTVWLRLPHGPVKPWAGLVRIVGRQVDDAKGTMQIETLTVVDDQHSAQPVGDGMRVWATITSRKETPQTRQIRTWTRMLTLTQRLARSS